MDTALYGLFVGIAATILILMKLHIIQNHTDAIGEMLHIIIYHPEHIEDLRLKHEKESKTEEHWKEWDEKEAEP